MQPGAVDVCNITCVNEMPSRIMLDQVFRAKGYGTSSRTEGWIIDAGAILVKRSDAVGIEGAAAWQCEAAGNHA